jgi:hypothetical protein
MCPIVNGYRNGAVSISRPKSVRFSFPDLDMKKEVNKRQAETRRIARSDFGRCCQHKDTWCSTQDTHGAIFSQGLPSTLRSTVGFFEHLLWTVTNSIACVTICHKIELYFHSRCFCICKFKQLCCHIDRIFFSWTWSIVSHSVSKPTDRGPVPGPGINYTGEREVLLEISEDNNIRECVEKLISSVQWLITNLNVILYLATCHTV